MWKAMAYKVITVLVIFTLASAWLLPSIHLWSDAFLVENTITLRSSVVPFRRSKSPNNIRTDGAVSRKLSTVRGLTLAFVSTVCIDEQLPTCNEPPSKLPINLYDSAENLEYALRQSKNATEDAYVATIEAWSRAGRPDKAEAIFQHYLDDNKISLSRWTYNALLVAQVRAQNVTRATEILANMENSSLQSQQPNIRDYNVLLAGYAQGGQRYMHEAQKLIERMEQRSSFNLKPDILSYSNLMDLYTVTDCVDVDKRIDEVVDRITSLASGKRFFTLNFMRPYQIPLNKALRYWKLSGRPDAAERAERVMKQMEEVDLANTLSYTQFMTILIGKDKRYSASQIAERVQNIGNNMLQSHKEGKRFVKPSTQTWNTIINAWVQCGRPDKAEEVLERMEMEFRDDNDMAPNVITYSTVMDGWVKSDQNDTLDHVEKLNERLKKLSTSSSGPQRNVRPNQRTHSALIRAYSKQSTVVAVEKAEELLYEMYREYENGNTDMKPNVIVLTTILEAWGVNGTKYGAERAEALLDFAIAADKDRNDPTLCPNEISFSSVISAWSRARCVGKAVNARRILNKMIALQELRRLDTTPNAFCYTAVINACAYCMNDESEKQNALRIAINTYKELDKMGTPNHVTYINMLVALQNLLPPSPQRSIAARDLFENAKRNGYVSVPAINRMKSILSNSELKSQYPLLLGDFRLDPLPQEWTRSINRTGKLALNMQ